MARSPRPYGAGAVSSMLCGVPSSSTVNTAVILPLNLANRASFVYVAVSLWIIFGRVLPWREGGAGLSLSSSPVSARPTASTVSGPLEPQPPVVSGPASPPPEAEIEELACAGFPDEGELLAEMLLL